MDLQEREVSGLPDCTAQMAKDAKPCYHDLSCSVHRSEGNGRQTGVSLRRKVVREHRTLSSQSFAVKLQLQNAAKNNTSCVGGFISQREKISLTV